MNQAAAGRRAAGTAALRTDASRNEAISAAAGTGASAGARGIGASAGAGVAMMVLVSLTLVYWIWYGVTRRAINNDDGISLLAVQGILEHGYPRLPSGYTYGRGVLYNYLMAGFATVFGLNDYALLIPPVLMGIGSLILVYAIAARVLGQPWLGVAAAAVLASLTIETWYATGPRMYIPLQFFTMVSVYCFWRGWVEGSTRFQVAAFVALAFGTLSNPEGAIVALGLPLATMVVLRLRGERWREIFTVRNVLAVCAIGIVNFLIVSYQPANEMPLVVGHGGVEPDRVGLNLSPIAWGRHVLQLERSIPYSLGFFFLAVLGFVASLRRGTDPSHRWSYVFLVFGICFLIYGTIILSGGHRHVLFILPLYALVFCLGVVMLFRFSTSAGGHLPGLLGRERLAGAAVLLLGITMSVGLSTLKQLNFGGVSAGRESVLEFVKRSFGEGLSFLGLAREGYGLPCSYDYRCDQSVKDELVALRGEIAAGDLVLSYMPMETSFYLGRVDGWYFFPGDGRNIPTLQRSPTDEYFGVPIIDTPRELAELMGGRRTWIILPAPDAESVRGPDPMWDAIHAGFQLHRMGREVETYVSLPD